MIHTTIISGVARQSGYPKLVFRVPRISLKKARRSRDYIFFIFFAKFLAYLMIFQSSAELWKIFKYGKNLAKNEEYVVLNLDRLAFKNPLFHGTVGTRNIPKTRFRRPIPPLTISLFYNTKGLQQINNLILLFFCSIFPFAKGAARHVFWGKWTPAIINT